MSVPAVNITEVDGSIGQVSGGILPMVMLGVSSSGSTAVPTPTSRKTDLNTTFGEGPNVEAAAYTIENFGRPVIMVRTGQTTAGSYQDVTGGGADETIQTGTGTSVVTTEQTSPLPNGNYRVRLRVIQGGTIATGPILFRYSLDGGATESGSIDLDTATSYTIPGTGVQFDFAAGTLVTGDTIYAETRAPAPNATEVGDAFDALVAAGVAFDQVHCTFPIDATLFDAIEAGANALKAAGKPITWYGNFRLPDYGEDDATYQAAFNTALGGKATTQGCVCAASAEITSGLSRRKLVQPVSVRVAAHHAAVAEHINIADVNLGAAAGVSIRDANGNPLYHDEFAQPGLDAMRATVLRTWSSPQGVYVNRPRIFSADGSDFYLVPHRRVMNLAYRTLLAYFVRRLNKPVRVNTTTGKIREEEALEIETGADAVLRAALMADPKASGGGFSRGRFVQLSREDNLLSSKTLTGQARIVPLAYPEFINIDLGFFNPALQVTSG